VVVEDAQQEEFLEKEKNHYVDLNVLDVKRAELAEDTEVVVVCPHSHLCKRPIKSKHITHMEAHAYLMLVVLVNNLDDDNYA
tara:strand:+ start:275 stop:520 length:246 start_codon:yes stop_codon:yes gene_type:complete